MLDLPYPNMTSGRLIFQLLFWLILNRISLNVFHTLWSLFWSPVTQIQNKSQNLILSYKCSPLAWIIYRLLLHLNYSICAMSLGYLLIFFSNIFFFPSYNLVCFVDGWLALGVSLYLFALKHSLSRFLLLFIFSACHSLYHFSFLAIGHSAFN